MFEDLFFMALVIYVSANLVFYMVNKLQYSVHSTLIRKGLYTLFVLGVLYGVLLGEVDYQDWKLLLQMSALVAFIDLSLFQTPNILKFWSAEFQHADTIEENIKKNEERLEFMNRKSSVFTEIMQEAMDELTGGPAITNKESYKNELEDFLKKYTDEFDFSVRIFFLPDDLEKEDEIKQGILQIVSRVENIYNCTIEEKETVQESLFRAEAYVFDNERHVIIPIYEGDKNFLITLSANQENIIEIDLANIINLVTVFNWSV